MHSLPNRAFALASVIASALASLTVLPAVAHGQESQLEGSKAAARTNAGDPSAALALGKTLRRAGHPTEAIVELRRGLTITARSGDAVALRFELARAQIARKDFAQAMVQCRLLGALPGGAKPGHACAAEAHLLWRRASEALTETAQALAGGAKLYDAKLSEGLAHEYELKESAAETSYR